MKFIYCSKCNTRLPLIKVGLKQYAQVIGVVNPHVCAPERIPYDRYFQRSEQVQYVDKEFVQNLDELPPTPLRPFKDDLRDRRSSEHVKSTAPPELFNALKSLDNSVPRTEMEEPDE